MKKKNGRKLLGVLLVLTMVLGLLHGMSLTVYSDTEKSETENEKNTGGCEGGQVQQRYFHRQGDR